MSVWAACEARLCSEASISCMVCVRTSKYDANETVVTERPTATVVSQMTRLAKLR